VRVVLFLTDSKWSCEISLPVWQLVRRRSSNNQGALGCSGYWGFISLAESWSIFRTHARHQSQFKCLYNQLDFSHAIGYNL